MNKSFSHTQVRSLHPKYVPFKSVEPFIQTTKVAVTQDTTGDTMAMLQMRHDTWSAHPRGFTQDSTLCFSVDTCHQTKRMYLPGGREEDCRRRPQEGSTGFSLTSTNLCSFIVTWELDQESERYTCRSFYTGKHRKVLNFSFSLITRSVSFLQGRVFRSKLHKFSMWCITHVLINQ